MSLDEERAQVHRQLDYLAAEIGKLETGRSVLIADITKAVRDAIPAASMTEDEHRWLRAAIQADAERAALRKAVIEKSIIGLFWVFLLFVGKVLYEYLLSHGWKS